MSDFKSNNLVVQSNKFVRQSYNNLKANEIKMFDIFVSCIDTMHPKTKIEITKSELLKAMGDSGTNYATTRDTLDSIFHKGFLMVDEQKTKAYHFIDSFEWYHNDDLIKVEFHKDIIPMLIELKTCFLQYSFSDLDCLKSRYSMLLYKYILSYIRQYNTLELTIPMEELRTFLNLKNKYKEFKAFRRNILDVFEKEVNESKALPYLVRYEKKGGKKVSAIRFLVRARTSNNETNFLDIQNPIMSEELTNNLIKGGTPLEEIRDRQFKKIWEEQNGWTNTKRVERHIGSDYPFT